MLGRRGPLREHPCQRRPEPGLDLGFGFGGPTPLESGGNSLPDFRLHGRIVGHDPVDEPLDLVGAERVDLGSQHPGRRLANPATFVAVAEPVMLHDLMGGSDLEFVPGEERGGFGQWPQPTLVNVVAVPVVSLAQRLRDGRLEPGGDVRGQPAGLAGLAQPPGDQGIGLVLSVGVNQGVEVPPIDRFSLGIPLDPRGEVIGQLPVASPRPQRVDVDATHLLLFVVGPLEILLKDAIEPRLGGRVFLAVHQRLGVQLLDDEIVRIGLGQLPSDRQRLVPLCGPVEGVGPPPVPALHGVQVFGLPLINRLQGLQQRQHLDRRQKSRSLASQMPGQEKLLGARLAPRRRLGKSGGVFEDPLLELLATAAGVEDLAADPSHPGLAGGQLLRLVEMLHHAIPLLASAEVEHQRQLVVEGRLGGGQRPLGVDHLGQRLAEELDLCSAGQLALHLAIERLGFQRLELLGGQRRAPAFLVGRLDASGPPAAEHLGEAAERGGRRQLAVLPVLDSQDDVAIGIHQDVDLVPRVVRVGQQQERLLGTLRLEFHSVVPVHLVKRREQVLVEAQRRLG